MTPVLREYVSVVTPRVASSSGQQPYSSAQLLSAQHGSLVAVTSVQRRSRQITRFAFAPSAPAAKWKSEQVSATACHVANAACTAARSLSPGVRALKAASRWYVRLRVSHARHGADAV